MGERLLSLARPLARAAFAAMLLAGCEVLWVWLRVRGLFLGEDELARYVSAAVAFSIAAHVALTFVGLLAVRLVGSRPRELFGLGALVVTASSGVAFWALTDGRRVRDLALRPVAVALGALVAGAAFAWLLARVHRLAKPSANRHARIAFTGTSFVLACLALVTSALVLPRLYPAFHLGLAVVAISLVTLAAAPWPTAPRRPLVTALGLAAAIVAFVLLPRTVARLAERPNALFVMGESAPLSGPLTRIVRFAPARAPAVPSHAPARRPAVAAPPAQQGLTLHARDVLLITVDALRADRLEALGSRTHTTPAIDALARDSAVFTRAYTTTPHTSYALASILTGKFIRPVFELPNPPADHATLPKILRRYGYRTAAFYPPAIFFVDPERFHMFADDGFGFEYRKAMFAPAADRVGQLDEYLRSAAPGHPLFVWVHLFEPHEPYDPPAPFLRGDSAVDRYDGEVRAADHAIGELVRTFRAQRPDATVIVTSDHGEEFEDHGGHYHGTTLFEEQVRVPIVWSSPGAVTATRIDAPVETVDLAPTLLAALGIPRDARMRGDDLGPVLRTGRLSDGPQAAFSSLSDQWMATNGSLKVLCQEGSALCRAFDLREDPRELVDVAQARTRDVAALRAELGSFIGSIPRIEALAVADGVGWPPALARAELNDPTAGPDVVPLLGDARPSIRAAAAKALAKLRHAPALQVLERLRTADEDPTVRAECALAGLLLGDLAAIADVRAIVLSRGEDTARDALERARRAALALAFSPAHDATGASVLVAMANDEALGETERIAALEALGHVGRAADVPALIPLLDDVRLRIATAETLGLLGGRPARDALARHLSEERYLPARTAEARALVRQRDRRVGPQLLRFLGMESPLPDGLTLLRDSHARLPRGAVTRDLRAESLPACSALAGTGCAIAPGASVQLPVPSGSSKARRLVIEASTTALDASLSDGDTSLAVLPGQARLVSFPVAAGRRAIDLTARGAITLHAYAIVYAEPEIPPPPPEAWTPDAPPSPSPLASPPSPASAPPPGSSSAHP